MGLGTEPEPNIGYGFGLVFNLHTPRDEENLIYVAATVYNIWFARNIHTFEDRNIRELETTYMLLSYSC
jgi:hypothetical protein